MTLKELDNLYASLTLETERGFIKGIHAAFISEDISTLSLLGFLERILTDFQPEGRRICAQRGGRLVPKIAILFLCMGRL